MFKNKVNQGNQSSKKIMKSKYLDNKSQTNSSSGGKNKVMLTDLCPQEKGKIGQLIKTLQQRKQQNQDLSQQLNSWKQNCLTLEKVKNELQNMIQSENKEFKKLNKQIQQLDKLNAQKDIQLRGIRFELQKQIKKYQDQSNKVSLGMNTQIKEVQTQQTQTKQKKVKKKDRQVQVNTIMQIGGLKQRQTRKNNFYQPNSKSFGRIMNGQRLLSSLQKNQDTTVFKYEHLEHEDSNNKLTSDFLIREKYSNIQAQKSSRFFKAQQLNEQNNWSQQQYEEQIRQNVQSKKLNQENIQIQDTENDDDQFQMLAKKWLQLKQKNIQQMTQGYFFKQNDQNTDQNTDLKSLVIQSKSINKQKQQNIQLGKLDQNELNKALKSRNFSASRLLNSKSKQNISQNSDKKSLQNSQASYHDRRLQNNKKKKSLLISSPKNTPKYKNTLEQSSKAVDFYSVELLELVQEINK